MIPPWSGIEGFHGYSAAAKGQGPLAWAMPTDHTLRDRFLAAEEFWSSWSSDPWPAIRDAATTSVESALGKHTNYYAIDGGNWPPRAMVKIPMRDGTALVTIGMGLLPQPNIEMHVDDPQSLRRIELAVLLPPGWKDADIMRFGSWLSGQAKLPWAAFTWLGHGHTIECAAWSNSRFTAAMLLRDHPVVPRFTLPSIGGDPVSMLWVLPLATMERKLAMQNGSESVIGKLSADRWREA